VSARIASDGKCFHALRSASQAFGPLKEKSTAGRRALVQLRQQSVARLSSGLEWNSHSHSGRCHRDDTCFEPHTRPRYSTALQALEYRAARRPDQRVVASGSQQHLAEVSPNCVQISAIQEQPTGGGRIRDTADGVTGPAPQMRRPPLLQPAVQLRGPSFGRSTPVVRRR
jgi:hypothetical protein